MGTILTAPNLAEHMADSAAVARAKVVHDWALVGNAMQHVADRVHTLPTDPGHNGPVTRAGARKARGE